MSKKIIAIFIILLAAASIFFLTVSYILKQKSPKPTNVNAKDKVVDISKKPENFADKEVEIAGLLIEKEDENKALIFYLKSADGGEVRVLPWLPISELPCPKDKPDCNKGIETMKSYVNKNLMLKGVFTYNKKRVDPKEYFLNKVEVVKIIN